MKLVLACALVVLGTAGAAAHEGCRSSCADGYVWSAATHACVPQPVSS